MQRTQRSTFLECQDIPGIREASLPSYLYLTVACSDDINAATFGLLDPAELLENGLAVSDTTGDLIQGLCRQK